MFTKKVGFSLHSFNGFIEEKFVEVDGKKFVDDGSGKAKVDDKGVPVPFKEAVPQLDLSTADIEALAKVNPKLAKFIADSADASKRLADIATAEEEKKRKDAEAKGEWQKLADEAMGKQKTAEALVKQKEEQLGKYVETVEKVLSGLIATIPKENVALIPADYSARQKLAYIIENAKLLGAKVAPPVDGVDKSKGAPDATAEGALVAEVDALLKKKPRTASEDTLLWEKSKQLKELRLANQKK